MTDITPFRSFSHIARHLGTKASDPQVKQFALDLITEIGTAEEDDYTKNQLRDIYRQVRDIGAVMFQRHQPWLVLMWENVVYAEQMEAARNKRSTPPAFLSY